MTRLASPAVCILLAAFMLTASAGERESVEKFRKSWREGRGFPANLIGARKKVAQDCSVEAADAVMDCAFREGHDGTVYVEAMRTLRTLGRNEKVLMRYIERVASDMNWRLRAALARLLGKFDNESTRVVPALHKALGDRAWQVQVAAVGSLRGFRDRTSIPVLVQALGRAKTGRLASEISAALRDLTGVPLDHVQDWMNWFEKHREDYAVAAGGEADREGDMRVVQNNPREARTMPSPNKLYGTVVSKRVIFIVDISNSMNIKATWGEAGREMSRIDVIKIELARVIEEQLPRDCRFNIITFADDVFVWKNKMVFATGANKKSAKSFIRKQIASRHTNSMGALARAFQDKEADTIYFLSDGTPTWGETTDRNKILKRARGLNTFRNITIHALAFLVGEGSTMKIVENKHEAASFMRRLADENGGFYKKFE